MASFSICEITDGTTTVSFLDPFFKLEGWSPAIAQPKGGGTWQSSPLADGRRLVNRRFDNTIETLDLSASAATQDSWAHQYQELERLLEKAVQYWTASWQNTPVYWKVKAGCETESRYALIYNYSLPNINQVLRAPFAGKLPGMSGFSLSLERGHWLANPPGEEVCVEISGTGGEGRAHPVLPAYSPVLNTDDGNYDNTGAVLQLGASVIGLGNVGGQSLDGIFRFQNVTIPQGSIITSAFVRFESSAADATSPVLSIRGQRGDAATLSTAANWLARDQTGSSVAWNPAAWVLGGFYNTPSIITVIQEIVDLPDWTSGDNLLIAVNDNGSPVNEHREPYSIIDVAGSSAILSIVYISASGAGRTATCLPEVFIANKHNYKGLTHIWYDDGGVFSGNLLGTGLPYDLLPAVPAVNDVLYFGIQDGALATITGGGPFFSLVFDLSAGQTGVTFGNGWEFWDSTAGPGWSALTVRDNTDTAEPLDTTGVNSVHWSEQSFWATTAINGVTGYWVRLIITGVATPTPPTQQTRDVYTILWPYVETDASQTPGDIATLLRIALDNQACYTSSVKIARIIMSLRSSSRGLDFTPYLNCSDQQEIPGIAISIGAGTIITTDANAPTERILQWAPAGVTAMGARAIWTFASTPAIIAPTLQWYGSFHAFARVRQTVGTGNDFALQLTVDIGDQEYNSSGSPSTVLKEPTLVEVVDLGRIDIPQETGSLNTTEALSTFTIELHASTLGAGTLNFYDLILMPIDEMIIDAQIQTGKPDGGQAGADSILSIDSTVYPKSIIRSLVRDVDDEVLSFWRTKGTLAFLQSNQEQRLWFFIMGWNSSLPVGWTGRFSMSARLQAFTNARYLSLRGER